MFNEISSSFQEIGEAFIMDPSIWWFLAPVFILWILLEVYFGEYKKEKLGFNSALANGVSLTWISIASIRFLFFEYPQDFGIRILVVTVMFAYGLFIIYISFTHRVSSRLVSVIAGPNTIYFLSTLSVLWGQGVLDIKPWIIFDLILVFSVIVLIFSLIKKYNLGARGEVEEIQEISNS